MMLGLIFLFFFFFQAEDGIRDYKVTGVQTCALPISLRLRTRWLAARREPRRCRTEIDPGWRRPRLRIQYQSELTGKVIPGWPEAPRSEERRVGKECRSRWSPYH